MGGRARAGLDRARAGGGVPGPLDRLDGARDAVPDGAPRRSRSSCGCSATGSPGAQAIQLRQKPIPWAYRVFFRHIGLDPDTTRTPIEQLIFERIHDGRFKSRNRVDDALTIAMVEVGVALRAFDADRVEGRVGLRLSAEGEGFEGRVSPLPDGTIVVADEKRPLGILFDRTAEGRGVKRATARVLLVAIGVRGVPDIAMEEALWVAGSALRA